jgi:hypothetical protein
LPRRHSDIFCVGRYFYLRHRPHQSQSLGHSAPVLLSMESSAVLTLSQLPYFSPQKSNRKRVSPSWPCKPRSPQPTRLRCQKMYVPGGYTVFLCVSNTYVCGRKKKKKYLMYIVYMGRLVLGFVIECRIWRSITRSQGSQQPPQFLHLHCCKDCHSTASGSSPPLVFTFFS